MDVIAAHLRQRAITHFPYLDNLVIRDLIHGRLTSQTIYCLQTAQSLGFIPNLDFKPAQEFTFIGMEFLTQQNIVKVPPDCIESLLLTIKHFLTKTKVSARTVLSLLGKLSAAENLVVLRRLHLRPLQMCLLSVWKPHILPLDHQVPITSMIRLYLKWWLETNRFAQGTFIHPQDPNAFLFTDAIHYGWGAHLEPMRLSFHGRCTEDQSQLHINILEMASHFALKEAMHYLHHLCYDIRQYSSGIIYQQTRRNRPLPPPPPPTYT